MFTADEILNDAILRVYIHKDTGKIDIASIGIDTLDMQPEGVYNNINTLPRWVQERIALLMLTPVNNSKPTVEVEDVGRRIDANTFWVYT